MSAIFSGGGGVATELDPVFSATGITAPLIANWNTAFGWGNHASAGYLLSATAANTYQPIDGDLTAIGGLSGTSGILRKTAANTWALDTTTYLSSFTETDPVFTASPAAGVTSQKITNWDTAFGWGNHASAGYQSALGFTPLNRAGDSISATNGSGFIGYPSQSGTPSTPSSGFRFYANASHALSWVGQNGFTRTFDGTANTANRTYTLPNASGTIALEGTLTSLANPTIQNGVYQFAQNTKPTQRAVGVPLVAGDRWYKTDDQTEWSWNGTYWISPPIDVNASTFWVSASSSNVVGFSLPIKNSPSNLILVATLYANTNIGGSHDINNYYIFSYSVVRPTTPPAYGAAIDTRNIATSSGRVSYKVASNVVASVSSLSGFFVVMSFIGSPGVYDYLGVGVTYHLIA